MSIPLPLVSIITVVYNGESTLERTIQSVIGQSYPHLEYLIIDGGSKDGTVDIIKKYESKIDYWISEPDNGLYNAMNKGIVQAKGRLIGMINSDDWYEKNAVQLVVDYYLKYPNGKIFHGDRYDVQSNGKKSKHTFHQSYFKFVLYTMTYNHPSMFVIDDVYKEELYNDKLKILADYQFVLSNFLKDRTSLIYIPVAYVNYSLTGLSSKTSMNVSIKEGFIARKNAGLKIHLNLISSFIRTVIFSIARIKRMI